MYLFFIVAGIALLGILLWRLASRRQSIPCPVWLRWLVELDNPFTSTNRAAAIIAHLDLKPGMAVLDAGCGPGRLTLPLAQEVGGGGQVVALDIQEGMLKRARQKVHEAKLGNVEFVHGGFGEDKLGQDRFDRALLVTVLGEVPEHTDALKEVYEALKPGGVLSVTEVIFDPHFQTRNAVLHRAESAGFREKAFYGNRLAYTLHLEKPGNK